MQEPVNPDVWVHVIIKKVDDIADRSLFQIFPDRFPRFPQRGPADALMGPGSRSFFLDR